MLWWFKKPISVDLARRRDPHALEPNANMEPANQGEPNESSNLVGAGVVPNSGQHLAIRQIVEIELLDEGVDYRDLKWSPQVHISLCSRITKEVAQGGGGGGGGLFTIQ
jgi:hypothetical protein